jgi:hypothetical protein
MLNSIRESIGNLFYGEADPATEKSINRESQKAARNETVEEAMRLAKVIFLTHDLKDPNTFKVNSKYFNRNFNEERDVLYQEAGTPKQKVSPLEYFNVNSVSVRKWNSLGLREKSSNHPNYVMGITYGIRTLLADGFKNKETRDLVLASIEAFEFKMATGSRPTPEQTQEIANRVKHFSNEQAKQSFFRFAQKHSAIRKFYLSERQGTVSVGAFREDVNSILKTIEREISNGKVRKIYISCNRMYTEKSGHAKTDAEIERLYKALGEKNIFCLALFARSEVLDGQPESTLTPEERVEKLAKARLENVMYKQSYALYAAQNIFPKSVINAKSSDEIAAFQPEENLEKFNEIEAKLEAAFGNKEEAKLAVLEELSILRLRSLEEELSKELSKNS